MSGGRFLIGLRDVTHSEKNIKLKSLLKGGINALTEYIFLKKDEKKNYKKFFIRYNLRKSNKGNHCLV